MVVPGIQRVTPLEEITVSDEWNGVNMAQDDFEEPVGSPATHSHDLTAQPGRSGIPVRLITLLSATMALGVLACTSEESLTEPAGIPSLARVAVARYTRVDLGALGAGEGECCSEAFGINPAGQVVGWSFTAADATHAFLWEKGVMSDLGTLGGSFSEAFGINPAGKVVGGSTTTGGQEHAFLWEKGVMSDLGTLGGGSSEARGINPAGQVVGWSSTAGVGDVHAFLWEKGVMTDLGTLRGDFSEAFGINPAGQVVGGVAPVDRLHAFIWEKGIMTDMTDISRVLTSVAYAINPAGQVVGTSENVIDEPHATLWTRK
jgi:probable HAF family extracellular repeat protein